MKPAQILLTLILSLSPFLVSCTEKVDENSGGAESNSRATSIESIQFDYMHLAERPKLNSTFKKGMHLEHAGKRLFDISRIEKIVIAHLYEEDVPESDVRKYLPKEDILHIINRYSVRSSQESDFINTPSGASARIHYKNGIIIDINYVGKTAYNATYQNKLGHYDSIGLSLSPTSQ